MPDTLKPYTMITDYLTGREIPNIGAEENRQAVAQYLVKDRGYLKTDILADVRIDMTVAGEPYHSQIDLVVRVNDDRQPIMVIKCAAGSLGSREREIIAAARLLEDDPIPLAVVSDGKTAIVLDAVTGKKTAEGMPAIPSKQQAVTCLETYRPVRLAADRLEREKFIFRTYDRENVNVQRNV